MGVAAFPCTCASPDTPIATPTGDRAIASLAVGDLVLSIDHGRLVSVPVRETHHTPVRNHRVIEVVLREGPTLRISAGHPTADGRFFGELRAGDWLGGREVSSAEVVPYSFDATYDILPDSDTGTYFAGGALIGSTLTQTAPRTADARETCGCRRGSTRSDAAGGVAGGSYCVRSTRRRNKARSRERGRFRERGVFIRKKARWPALT